jgi:hypothetical protein
VNSFAEFQRIEHRRSTVWARRSFAKSPMIELLADPDLLLARPDCVLVKDQRKITVGRVALIPNRRAVYVKRYNAFSFRYRVQSLFCRSGAVRSLRGAALLSGAGIAVAAPVAAVEVRRRGMLERSYYIAEEISGGKTADAYWREELKRIAGRGGFRARRRFLAALGALFKTLHGARIYHDDLKDFNILVRDGQNGEQELFLLDLEGVRRCRVLSARRKVKNLVQLHRTLGKFLSRTEELAVLKSYLRASAAPARWVESILAASRRADALSRAKSARPAERARV